MPPVKYHYDQFPPHVLAWDKLIPYVGSANAAVARYDGLLEAIPNVEILLSPLTTNEAVLSSKIEGTHATMGDVLEYEASENLEKFSGQNLADIHEILNYRHAMQQAIEMLKELPLCQRVITNIHATLLNSVRGHGKAPGEYRKIPNWIGALEQEKARFIPVSADKLPQGMSDWEKYINSEQPDRLVQLAIMHAEFEALHPFLDGNGRLGRICIPLFMYKQGLIKAPMFYIIPHELEN